MLLTALLALADGTTVQACPTLAELKLGTRTPHRYFVRCLDVGGTASHAPFPGGQSAVLLPNQTLVVVLYGATAQTRLTANGVRGLVAPEVEEVRAAVPTREPATGRAVYTFASFQPGSVTLTVEAPGSGRTLPLSTDDNAKVAAFIAGVDLAAGATPELAPLATALHSVASRVHVAPTTDPAVGATLARFYTVAGDGTAKDRVAAELGVLAELDGQGAPFDVVGTAELDVDSAYIGALGVGVGFAFLSAADATYSPYVAPGSATPEVAVTNAGPADYELLLTYVQYLHAFGKVDPTFRCGPTAGIGIASIEEQKLTGTSVYLGWGFGWPKFWVTPAIALRRVTRLASDVEVGSPLADNTQPQTYETWQPGPALMLTVPQLITVKK